MHCMSFILRKLYKCSKVARTQWVRHAASGSTIYSLSSGHVKCGVAVIRVSGPHTKQAVKALVGREDYEPRARHAHLKSFYHPQTKEMIDKGILLWFPGPASFTGEDSCEFQVHGSFAVIAAMADALGAVAGLRPAEPGEFTKRAFFSNKLDLTEVEGLADLIHSETEAQRKQALLQSTGALSRLYADWRKRLIKCAAHLEAYIDFGEDENIEDDVVEQLIAELRLIKSEIQTHLNDQRQGELLRGGVRTAIVGAPNVGKSSFLNLMCQRQVSIVTPQAGTTRDIIESTQNFGGYPVVFADTAGLRKDTSDAIEREGISLAKHRLEQSDLVLLLTDASLLLKTIDTTEEYVRSYFNELDIPTTVLDETRVQLVANKTDMLTTEQLDRLCKLPDVWPLSCRTNEHLPNLLMRFERLLKELCGSPAVEHPRLTSSRYRQLLVRCVQHIDVYLGEYTPDKCLDMAIGAQKLRNAVQCIERITGRISTDDILDVVFRDFCIGK